MVVVYAILLASCGALVRSRLAILITPALSVFASPLTVTMVQFRPDCLAIAMFLLSVLFLLRGYEFSAGLLGAAALLCSEKAGIYLLAIPFFLLPRGVFASTKYFLASALALGAVVGLALYSGAAKPFLDSTVSWAIAHEQHYPTQFTDTPMKHALRYDYLGITLFILGSSMMLLRERLSVSLGFAAVFGLTLVSAVIQRAPYNYTLVPLLTVSFLMSLFFFKEVERKIPQSPLYATPVVIALMCMMLMSHNTFSGVEKNEKQMALLRTISEVSVTSDYFYDNRGMYVTRPHATKWWFTDLMMRERYPLLDDVRNSFNEKDVMFFIREDRFEMLPAEIKSFVLARFLPYKDELYVWGRSWEGAVSDEVNVPRTGDYVVKGSVVIDGAAVESGMIRLTRGSHRVVSAGEFSIAWKPQGAAR
jgi:hypothetical protein